MSDVANITPTAYNSQNLSYTQFRLVQTSSIFRKVTDKKGCDHVTTRPAGKCAGN